MKNKLRRVDKYQIMVLVIILLSTCHLLFLATQKEGMHNDEYSTYKLANAEWDKVKFNPTYGVKLDAHDIFDHYFYPNGFSLQNVWLNQKSDVHPPLYYLLFHIFILTTHHFWGLKTGILLNIMIHMINIGLVWLLLKEMLSKRYMALLGTIFYAFLPIVLGTVLFIRMYVLVSTFILALTLLFAKRGDKSETNGFYIKLGLLSVAGTMTHYYFLFYLFYYCLVWGIYLIVQRKWKKLTAFLGTMTASGIACLVIFPYMLQHFFESGRGQELFAALFSLSTFISNSKTFWHAINNVCGGFLPIVMILAVGLVIFRYIFGKDTEKIKFDFRWFCILFSSVLYILTVAKVAPLSVARYISPIYAICVVLLMGLFDKIISNMINGEYIGWMIGVLMLGILTNSSYNNYAWSELYKEAADRIAVAKDYGAGNECIYIISKNWHGNCSYPEFIQYRNITFFQATDLSLLYTEEFAGYDHVVMYVDRDIQQDKINTILEKMIEMNLDLDSYEKLHMSEYNDAYYLD